jgi:hypothetical protein
MSSPGNHRNQTGPAQKPAPASKGRLRQLWQDYQWPLGLALLALSFLLGYVGFAKYAAATGIALKPSDILYLTLQLATLESGAVSGPVSWELEVARWLIPLVAAYTAVLAAAMLFRKQLQMVKLWFIRDHVVICGLGEKGHLLADGFRDRGYGVVVIERDADHQQIPLCRERGIVVLTGDATEAVLLRKVAVQRASHLVSVCGDDGTNAEVAMAARPLVAARKRGALTCTIHLVDPHLCELLREQELGAEAVPTFRLELFNVFERGARSLLRAHPAFGVQDGTATEKPHLLVVGLGRLGESLVVHAARDWHERYADTGRMLRITVVDGAAEGKACALRRRYPQLPRCCDLAPVQMNLHDASFQGVDFLAYAASDAKFDIIYVCLADHSRGLQAALALRHQLDGNEPPIVVRMPRDSGLATLLHGHGGEAGAFRNIQTFALLERTCTPELVLGGTHELLARAVHAEYLRQRDLLEQEAEQDRALVPWDDLPEDLRASNRRQVDHIRLNLSAAGYGIKPLVDWQAASYRFEKEEIEQMACREHERWMEERRRRGWVYGPGDKNEGQKTHPDLLPWASLPDGVKNKDRQAMEALPELLARAGFQVVRL